MVKKNILIGVLFPMLLFAWGNDFVVTTTTDMGQSYDIATPYLGKAYYLTRTIRSDTIFQAIYFSNDTGKTWNRSYTFYVPSVSKPGEAKLLCYPGHVAEYLPVEETKYLYVIIFDTSLLTYSLKYLDFSSLLDTVINTKIQMVKRGTEWEFYIGVLGKKNDSTLLSVWKEDTTWTGGEILHRVYTTYDNIHLTLLDLDIHVESPDSVLIIPTLMYHDASSGTYGVESEFHRYRVSLGTVSLISALHMLKYTGQYPKAACSMVGNLAVWAISDTGLLYFVWTQDRGVHYTDPMEYPYQSGFDYISFVDMVPWMLLLNSGFNLAFVGRVGGINNVWYHEIYSLGDSIGFNPDGPVQVSDSGYFTYLANFSPYYSPRIRNVSEMAGPYIAWHYDYTHFGGNPPSYYFDSTRFFVDWMVNYTNVTEKEKGSPAHLVIKNRGDRIELTSGLINGSAEIRIIDVSGRVVFRRRFDNVDKRLSLDIGNLKKGVYFIEVKTIKHIIKGRFVKVR